MKYWSYGKVIMTQRTMSWSKDELDNANYKESLIIFSNFNLSDEGRSRQEVCKLNPIHPDFMKNKIMIKHTPEYYETLKELNRLLNEGIEIHPLSPIHEKLRKLIFD